MSKMIVMDMDGTLLRSDGTCSEETKEYLNNLKSDGHTIVLATGRTLRAAKLPTEDAYFANYIITNNGALIYDVDNNDFLFKSTISKDNVKKVCSFYNQDIINFVALGTLNYYNRYSKEYFEETSQVRMIKSEDELDKLACETIDMTMNLKHQELIDDMIRLLNESLPELDFSVMQDSFASKKWIRIGNDGTNKYTAIEKIANAKGIDNNDIICFGDGLNDLDMLANCGLSVAMGNALDEVKVVCDDRTDSNDDDGVIRYLERYFEYNRVMK